MGHSKVPETPKEALTLAVTLVLTAPDGHEEDIEQLMELIEQYSSTLTDQEIDEVKAIALAEAHLILGG
mgnify:FL=1|tara:strand:- start:276 stop:482 length:207 start_codon:yes stop_codon:yes gene_type:complete